MTVDPEAPVASTTSSSTGVTVERSLRAVAWALVGAVAVMLVWRVVTLDWTAAGDLSVIRLRALDVGTANTPLVGAYSRYKWNHPGPSLSFAFAPWVRMFGSSGVGILVGSLVCNALAVAGALWVAWRRSRTAFMVAAIVLTGFVLLLEAGELYNPWNPYVIVVPLFAALFASWGVLRGDRVAAVVLVIAASFAIQGHLGSAPLGLTALAMGAIGLVHRSVRGPEEQRPHSRRTLLIAGAVLFVCWIPPLIDELFGSHNLSHIIDFQLHSAEQSAGLRFAIDQITRLLTFPPGREIGFPGIVGTGVVVPWMAIVLVGATVMAWRKQWWDRFALAVVAWIAIVVSTLAIAQVKGIPFQYLIRWSWAAVLIVWIACVWVAVSLVAERAAIARRLPDIGLAALSLLLVGVLVAGVDFGSVRGWDASLRTYSPVIAPTLDVMRSAPKPVLVTTYLGMADGTVANELIARADDAGIEARRTPDLRFVFGDRRVVDPADAGSQIVIVTYHHVDRFRDDPRYRLVAFIDPLTSAERAELEQLAKTYSGREGDTSSDPQLQRYRQLYVNADAVWVYYSDTPPFAG